MNPYRSKNLVNTAVWDKYVDVNDDGYGVACVKIARRVMEYLDEHPDIEFSIGYSPDMTTPHGIICHCDYDEGITGFMADAVRSMVARSYRDGWKFHLASVISPYDGDEEVMGAVEKVCEAVDNGLIDADKDAVKQYAFDLLARYKGKEKNDDKYS